MAEYQAGSNFKVQSYLGPEVLSILPEVGPLIDKAVAAGNGEWSSETVLQCIIRGFAVLWVMFEDDVPVLVAVIRFEQYETYKATVFWYLGGTKLRAALPFWPVFKQFMLNNGSYVFTTFGRPGFERVLRNLGIRPAKTWYSVDIRNLM